MKEIVCLLNLDVRIRLRRKLAFPVRRLVRGWKNNQEKLKSFVGGKNVDVRKSQKIRMWTKRLENRLIAWVHERNKAGLRVKDKLLNSGKIDPRCSDWGRDRTSFCWWWQHRNSERHSEAEELRRASSSCSGSRFELVSQRHTTSRSLSDGFGRIAYNFISDIDAIISDKKIELSQIVNLDQVPRYFETGNTSSIITRPSSQIHGNFSDHRIRKISHNASSLRKT